MRSGRRLFDAFQYFGGLGLVLVDAVEENALLDGYGRGAVSRDDRQVIMPLCLLAFAIQHAVRFAAQGRLSDALGLVARTGYERLP